MVRLKIIVLILLVILIVGKKLNIIDPADRIKPYLTTVTIESNNAIDKYSAEVGDIIILTMEFSEKIKGAPTVVINNTDVKAVEQKQKNVYIARYPVEEQYHRDQKVEFKIENYKDTSNNIGIPVTLTTNNSKVVIREQNTIITPVAVESIKIESKKRRISINESIKIKSTIKPANATNKKIIWTSSNPEVATVEDGVVTGITEGTTTITADASGEKSTIEILVKVME